MATGCFVANFLSDNISVLLGNRDGTFPGGAELRGRWLASRGVTGTAVFSTRCLSGVSEKRNTRLETHFLQTLRRPNR
jgi:hypothetical protein